MKSFIISDRPAQIGQLPDSGNGGVQHTWSWRNRQWEERNESVVSGRMYRGMSGYRRAKSIAKKLMATDGIKTHVAIDRQWAVY